MRLFTEGLLQPLRLTTYCNPHTSTSSAVGAPFRYPAVHFPPFSLYYPGFSADLGWAPRKFEACRNEVILFLRYATCPAFSCLAQGDVISNPGLHVLTGPTAKHPVKLPWEANNARQSSCQGSLPCCHVCLRFKIRCRFQLAVCRGSLAHTTSYVSDGDLKLIRYSTENQISISAGQTSI